MFDRYSDAIENIALGSDRLSTGDVTKHEESVSSDGGLSLSKSTAAQL